MPGTPKPVGSSGNLDTLHNAIAQGMTHQRALTAALSAVSSAQASLLVKSATNAGTFTPTVANDQELMSSPAVTAQIGTSGQAILTVSSLIAIVTTAGNTQKGIIFYGYTPSGGSQVGPGSQVIASFGGFATSSALTLSSSVTGSITLGNTPTTKLPAGLITFNLWAESSGLLGASMQQTALTVQPL